MHSFLISVSSFLIALATIGKKSSEIKVSICFCEPVDIFDKIHALSFLICFFPLNIVFLNILIIPNQLIIEFD